MFLCIIDSFNLHIVEVSSISLYLLTAHLLSFPLTLTSLKMSYYIYKFTFCYELFYFKLMKCGEYNVCDKLKIFNLIM